MPARLHAPRTRTGPTLPRTSPPLFQGIPSTLFLPLKRNPNFNLSAGAPLPSSPPAPTLAVALHSPCALPSPARTQPPRLRRPQAAPRPPRPAPNTHLSPKHFLGPSIPLFPSILGTLFPSHKDKTKNLPCTCPLQPCSRPQLLHPRSLAAVALSSRSGDSLPRHARNPHARHGTHATPTQALCTTGSPPPSPRPAPTHLHPPLPGNFPHHFKGIQPIHPSTPFSNKQSNSHTHTHSKPKTKTKTSSLEPVCWNSADSLTSVPPCSPWPSALPSALPSPLFRHYPQAPPSCPGPFPHEPLWAPFLTSFRSHVLRGPHPPPSSPLTPTNQKPKTTTTHHHHHRSRHKHLP